MERTDDGSSSVTEPALEGMAPTLARNIQVLKDRAAAEEANATLEDKIADKITAFTGSMLSVYLHFVFFGGWILINAGLTPIPPWDPSMVVLAMMASVEAIFLSTFVLISQNRMAQADNRRAELDLQTSLLTETEVTKLITMVSAIADRLDVSTEADDELPQLKQNVAPEKVLDRIEDEERARS